MQITEINTNSISGARKYKKNNKSPGSELTSIKQITYWLTCKTTILYKLTNKHIRQNYEQPY
jgi:hypothetical protein